MKNMSGFTLLEILVTFAIGGIIIAMLLLQYASVSNSNHKVEQKVNAFTNFAIIKSAMRDSIMQAGFTPCVNFTLLTTAQLPRAAITASDHGFNVRRMDNNFATVLAIEGNNVQVNHTKYLDLQHPLIIADCYHAEMIHVNQSYNHHLQLTRPLQFAYQLPAWVGNYLDEQYMVNMTGAGNSALFYRLYDVNLLADNITTLALCKENNLYHVTVGTEDTIREFNICQRAA